MIEERPLFYIPWHGWSSGERARCGVPPAGGPETRPGRGRGGTAAQPREQEGNFLTRTVPDLFGGAVEAELRPRVSYSRTAVRGFAARVKRAGDRPPRDATSASWADGYGGHSSHPALPCASMPWRGQSASSSFAPNHVVQAPVTKRAARHTLADLRATTAT